MPLIDRYIHFSNCSGDLNKYSLMICKSMQIKISEALKPSLDFWLCMFSRFERSFSPTIISAVNDQYRWLGRSDNRKDSRIIVGPRIRSYATPRYAYLLLAVAKLSRNLGIFPCARARASSLCLNLKLAKNITTTYYYLIKL